MRKIMRAHNRIIQRSLGESTEVSSPPNSTINDTFSDDYTSDGLSYFYFLMIWLLLSQEYFLAK